MDMPEGAEGHSVASDGVGALIEGPKVAVSQTRLYLDGAPGTHPQHQHPNSTRARYLTDISKSHRIFPKVPVYFFISRFFFSSRKPAGNNVRVSRYTQYLIKYIVHGTKL